MTEPEFDETSAQEIKEADTSRGLALDSLHPALLNAIKLGVFAIVAAIVLGSTYSATAIRIAASQAAVEEKALLEVVQTIEQKRIDLADRVAIPAAQLDLLGIEQIEDESIQIVRDNEGVPVAFILPALATDGYSGDIRFLVGIDRDSEITGVRVIEHRETPGLGDKIDIKKSDWILSFNGKALNNPQGGWAVQKDGGEFDAFTGATITPRAMVNRIKAVLDYYALHNIELIEQAQTGSVQEAD